MAAVAPASKIAQKNAVSLTASWRSRGDGTQSLQCVCCEQRRAQP